MKRLITLTILIISCMFCSSSCSKKEDADTFRQTKDDYFIYHINQDIYAFDINEKNELY